MQIAYTSDWEMFIMARRALLNTDTEDLKELLSNGKSYTVPPYQRD